MKAEATFLEIAVWEFSFDSYLKPLNDLIRRKYAYLNRCRAKDLFALPDDEAKWMHERIVSLEDEVATSYAVKNMIVRLRTLYMDATADIGETIHQERLDLLSQVQYWQSRYEAEHAECMREKAEVLFWVEMAQNYARNGAVR